MISDGNPWLSIRDGDPRAYALYKRHYSFRPYRDNRRRTARYHKILGPGEYMLLITPELDALFAWRKFIDKSGMKGVNCAIFRNEGERKSSELIMCAVVLAEIRWPGETLYTFVNPKKIRSTNPGACFKYAGWKKIGETKKGLHIFVYRDKEP